ncbi:hypothetical protein BH11BAC4_BH11BAC4_16090 [soil metagenome]
MRLLRNLSAIIILLIFIGCSKSSTNENNGTSNPLPLLLAVSPANAVSGGGAFTITVTGTNFINGSVIKWKTTSLATTYISATQLSATVPAVNISIAGSAAISVFTPTPGGGMSAVINFTINPAVGSPLPQLNSLSPNSATVGGSSFILTTNGAGFVNGSVIRWNGSALTTTYTSATQLSATIPATAISTVSIASVTVFSPGPGGGTSAGLEFNINAASTTKRFLFDATHGETAGNADWVIDEDGSPQNIPTPLQSTITSATTDTYWTGALSSWGIALAKQGHSVETLPMGNAITYGNASNPLDLANYNVFVVDEPNNVFTAAEKVAILNFVNNGGGLFMVSDHTASDRDSDGWDSPAIWNDLMTNNTVQVNPFGFSIDLANFSEISSNVLTNSSSSVVLTGLAGNVSQLQYSNGTSATINPVSNPSVKGLIWKTAATQNNNNIISLTSGFGTGRIFFVGDSSPLDDGTGGAGNTLYTSWPNFSHIQLFMNASLWLAKVQ